MHRRLLRPLLLVLWFPLCALAGPVAPGQPAPALNLVEIGESSDTVNLADYRGSVVYVDFWASWCGPCRLSFPQLQSIRTELNARGFEIVAVNVDEFEADALSFLEEVPVDYPVVRDGSGDTPQRWGLLGMPTGFLVDREGIVRKVHQGFRKSDGEKIRAEILQILGE